MRRKRIGLNEPPLGNEAQPTKVPGLTRPFSQSESLLVHGQPNLNKPLHDINTQTSQHIAPRSGTADEGILSLLLGVEMHFTQKGQWMGPAVPLAQHNYPFPTITPNAYLGDGAEIRYVNC